MIYLGDTTSPTLYHVGSRISAEEYAFRNIILDLFLTLISIISNMTNKTHPIHSVPTSTSTAIRIQPSKTPPSPPPNPSPNPTANNAVWLAEDGSQALVKLAIPGLLESTMSIEVKEEQIAQRMKRVVFIRHDLQKAFFSRGSNPTADRDIAKMSELLTELEGYEDLESSVIWKSKIHKVLRLIAKLEDMLNEDERDFQQRVSDLLETYMYQLADGLKNESATPGYSVLLNFTISANGRHVLLNSNYHALQIPAPSRPALLSARIVPSRLNWIRLSEDKLNKYPLTGLDYSLDARNRDDPNIRYSNYHPELSLNLVGAGGSRTNQSDPVLLLDSLDQKWIKLSLHDTTGISSDDPNRQYSIDKVEFMDRSRDIMGRMNIDYRAPRPDDRPCTLRSWRCADIADPPWYKHIWRQNFDKYGRIGSLRRALMILCLPLRFVLLDSVPWWTQLLAIIAVVLYVRGRLARRKQEDDLEKGKARIG